MPADAIIEAANAGSYYFNIDSPINNFLKMSGVKTQDDIITLNGDTYKLDSCLLSNYNNFKPGMHAIAGITCKNENMFIMDGQEQLLIVLW